MTQIFESATVTLRKGRYDELLKKEAAFDAYRRKVKMDIERGWGSTDTEKALFLGEELDAEKTPELTLEELVEEKTEEPKEIFTESEWNEITAMAEEGEEDNGTETV